MTFSRRGRPTDTNFVLSMIKNGSHQGEKIVDYILSRLSTARHTPILQFGIFYPISTGGGGVFHLHPVDGPELQNGTSHYLETW